MRNSAVTIFIPWQKHSTKCESQEKLHFPPNAVPASCQDLIAASYKILIWRSKWSRITSLVLFSCLITEVAWQGTGSPAAERFAQLPRFGPTTDWKEVYWEDKQPYHRPCPPSSIPAYTTDTAVLSRQAACLDSSDVF